MYRVLVLGRNMFVLGGNDSSMRSGPDDDVLSVVVRESYSQWRRLSERRKRARPVG